MEIDSPLATSLNCMDHALIFDDDFVEECQTATANAVKQHTESSLQHLDEEIKLFKARVAPICKQLRISNHFDSLSGVAPPVDPQAAIEATPLKDLLLKSIPVNKIRVETERVLWHQRLGHPCDKYLYSAHKFIDGVPKFKRRSDVM